MSEYHKNEGLEEDKITNLTYSYNESNFYIIAAGEYGEKPEKESRSFVSVYKVLENPNYYELERWYKFEMSARIESLSTYENSLVVVYWEAMKIINLDTRVLKACLTVSKKNVGWAFLVRQNPKDCCVLTGRGFNAWKPNSGERKTGIYVAKLVF